MMWQELLHLWSSVKDPEYLHLLLEGVPLYGLGFGLVFLAAAQFMGESKARLVALLLITTSCASVWPYEELRQQSTPRIVATRDPALEPLIKAQTERRSSAKWAYYSLAALGLVTTLTQMAGKARPLLAVLVVGAAAMFWFSIWLHKKECEVYHRNIVKYYPPRAG